MNDKYRLYSKMTAPSIAVLIFIGIISITLAGSKSSSESVEDIIKVAELGDKMVTSGKGTVTFEWGQVDSTGAWKRKEPVITEMSETRIYDKMEVFIAFSGEKYRQEISNPYPTFSGEMFEYYEHQIYDGTNYYYRQIQEQHDTGYEKRRLNSLIIKNPRFYGQTILGTPVASFLESKIFNTRMNSENVTLEKLKNLGFIGEDIIDEIQCMVFRGNYSTEYKMRDVIEEGIITVWLAPDMMNRPKCIEKIYEKKSQGEIHKWKIVHYNNFSKYGSIWFPDNVQTRFYQFDNNSNEWILRAKYIYDVNDDFEVNIYLPDSLFTVPSSQVR